MNDKTKTARNLRDFVIIFLFSANSNIRPTIVAKDEPAIFAPYTSFNIPWRTYWQTLPYAARLPVS